VMRESDYIVDIGPGSGKCGGEVIAAGSLEELLKQDKSVTGSYLRSKKVPNIGIRKTDKGFVEVINANRFNLKNVNVKFPIGCLTSVTGVSGSGKSTLVFEVLAISDTSAFDKVITVEQSALSRMKRSNVATYCDLYLEIRKIFGSLDEAKEKGLDLKHFSFNTKGGRCEYCEGLGYVESNMLFFENIDVLCPVCGGNQFNEEVLSVAYKGYSIKEVLKMSVDEAMTLFNHHAKIKKSLKLLQDVGLSYLELGQTLTTLSGGEGQRLKLAKELIVSENKRNLYLIDEPTTGLHPLDVEKFLILLNRMVDAGNTVIVVEHSIQVIEASDWVVDLGPLGGIHGGQVIATGTPLDIAKSDISQTGRALRKT
jgi:excinuclease ABC subunit A